ncbi:hypothetical protein CORC01_12928 [Colletotrichum orchidophilum]|uniref:Uncharacterized protein n=1 Tax=Colletotrichum orchidophilum TaxID=1209926 RepID=A0A1G4ARF1_9PEZI|nr:uncharacterized protein CORC01_12928 [Colletotrichum orchidophilum]OHE91754.1 hypothetical protein CORC01_12928 [Colletotrichum orchidophilum]
MEPQDAAADQTTVPLSLPSLRAACLCLPCRRKPQAQDDGRVARKTDDLAESFAAPGSMGKVEEDGEAEPEAT